MQENIAIFIKPVIERVGYIERSSPRNKTRWPCTFYRR